MDIAAKADYSERLLFTTKPLIRQSNIVSTPIVTRTVAVVRVIGKDIAESVLAARDVQVRTKSLRVAMRSYGADFGRFCVGQVQQLYCCPEAVNRCIGRQDNLGITNGQGMIVDGLERLQDCSYDGGDEDQYFKRERHIAVVRKVC